MDLRDVLLFLLVLKPTKFQTLGCYREGRRHFIFFFLLREKQNIGKDQERLFRSQCELVAHGGQRL